MHPPRDQAQLLRQEMVDRQIRARGIRDERVLQAMSAIPRHRFIPCHASGSTSSLATAYGDHPVRIGHGQTISQPYIVALMTELLNLPDQSRVLDIGTGSGYQAAVLAELASRVFTVEIIPELAATARERLQDLGYNNISFRTGDAFSGWPEAAPFDGIIVAAAPSGIPTALVNQLAPGGRLVIPVGSTRQRLKVITVTADGVRDEQDAGAVAFVPMTGSPDSRLAGACNESTGASDDS